jgi:serine/threonine protein kinase
VLIDGHGRARLIDFGLTIILDTTRTKVTSSTAGTLRWMAPELFDPEKYGVPKAEVGIPTRKTDIYALGITAWEVINISLTTLLCTLAPDSNKNRSIAGSCLSGK